MANVSIDLRGLKCPLPALKTLKALGGLAPGEVLTVACTDPMAAIDIPNLVRETGDVLLDQQLDHGAQVFRIRKAGAVTAYGAADMSRESSRKE